MKISFYSEGSDIYAFQKMLKRKDLYVENYKSESLKFDRSIDLHILSFDGERYIVTIKSEKCHLTAYINVHIDVQNVSNSPLDIFNRLNK